MGINVLQWKLLLIDIQSNNRHAETHVPSSFPNSFDNSSTCMHACLNIEGIDHIKGTYANLMQHQNDSGETGEGDHTPDFLTQQ